MSKSTRTCKTVMPYRRDIINKLRALELYRDEYGYAVDTLARALYDYDRTMADFEADGGKIVVDHTNKAGATNPVKNPLYLVIEGLRADILAYSRELGLTPTATKRLHAEGGTKTSTHTSALDRMLKGLEQDAP